MSTMSMMEREQSQVEEIMMRARAMRAQAASELLRGIAHGVVAAPRWVVGALVGWTARRRAREELLSLDDRLLRDVGLTRSDIAAALAGERIPDRSERRTPERQAYVVPAGANVNELPTPDARKVA